MEASAILNVDIKQFMRLPDFQQATSMLALTNMHMLETGINFDIELKASDGYVKAHRVVLASFSSVFEAMLENHTSAEPMEVAMSIEALKVLLILLYGASNQYGTWLIIKEAVNKHFQEIFEACHKFQIFRLVPTLNEALPGHLTEANCWDMYRKSLNFYRLCQKEMPGVPDGFCRLHEHCVAFIKDNAVPSQ